MEKKNSSPPLRGGFKWTEACHAPPASKIPYVSTHYKVTLPLFLLQGYVDGVHAVSSPKGDRSPDALSEESEYRSGVPHSHQPLANNYSLQIFGSQWPFGIYFSCSRFHPRTFKCDFFSQNVTKKQSHGTRATRFQLHKPGKEPGGRRRPIPARSGL
jgi:hypothetical protein